MNADFDLYYGDILGTDATDGEVRCTLGFVEHEQGHATEVPLLGVWGFYSRPMPPSMVDNVTAAAQAQYFRDGNEFYVMGVADNRYIAKLGDLEEGGIVVCHPGGGFVRLGFNNSENGTNVTLYSVRNDANGNAQKASVIAMNSEEADAHIALVHEKGHSITMNVDGDIVIASHTGEAFVHVNGNTVVINGASVCITGGVSMGSDNPAAQDFVALATAVQANLELILGVLQNWTPVPNDGGAALQTAANLLTLTPVASSKVKAAF